MAPADNRPTQFRTPRAQSGAESREPDLPQAPRLSRAKTLLVPNLAQVLACSTLFYCLFLYPASQLFRDSDSGWHIRAGEWILAHRALPPADLFSFSKPNAPWFAWEWLSDAAIGALHQSGGLPAVAFCFALVAALSVYLWVRLSFSAGGDFFLTALFAIPMVTTVSLHWLARPHVFSWIFLLAALLAAERASAKAPQTKSLVYIALASALWANLHASFFLGAAIALVYAIGHLLRALLWNLEPVEERRKARWFFLAAAASLLGSFVNPYGWRLHAHIFEYLSNSELTSRIAEFQSFNFHDKDATQIVLALALAALGGVLALGQKKVAHFLLSALFLVAALRSARVIPLVALLILPLANGALKTALHNATGLAARLRSGLHSFLRESRGLQRIDRQLRGPIFMTAFLALTAILVSTPEISRLIQFPTDRFPVAAANSIAALPQSARIYSSDSFGGYLIYRFQGARKVFFDGRSDFYGVDFLKDYLTLSTARPGWRDLFRRYQFTNALLPADSALEPALLDSGWKVLYRDKSAVLLEEAH